jgi:hypothetical protein
LFEQAHQMLGIDPGAGNYDRKLGFLLRGKIDDHALNVKVG